jgi:hypothetical protein
MSNSKKPLLYVIGTLFLLWGMNNISTSGSVSKKEQSTEPSQRSEETEEDVPQAFGPSEVSAKCICPPGIGSQRASGCSLLLNGIPISVTNYYTYTLYLPNQEALSTVSKVASGCPVKAGDKVNRPKELKLKFTLQKRSQGSFCTLCSRKNENLVLADGPQGGNESNPETGGDETARSFKFALFRNAIDEDVLWHLIWTPGLFQLLPARDAALSALAAVGKVVEDTDQLIVIPLRRLRRAKSLVQFIDTMYRLLLGNGLALLRGFTAVAETEEKLPEAERDKRLMARPFQDTADRPQLCCSEHILLGQWRSYVLWNPTMKPRKGISGLRLQSSVRRYVETYSAKVTERAIAAYGDAPVVDGQVLNELRNDEGWDKKWRRWRGVRQPIEDSIFTTLEGMVGLDLLRLFNSKNLTLQQQFQMIRSSEVIVAPEGSFMSWLVFARPGQTWIMVYDHGRMGSNDFRHYMYHAQFPLFRCGVRMIVVETIKNALPPAKLWQMYVPSKLGSDAVSLEGEGLASIPLAPGDQPQVTNELPSAGPASGVEDLAGAVPSWWWTKGGVVLVTSKGKPTPTFSWVRKAGMLGGEKAALDEDGENSPDDEVGRPVFPLPGDDGPEEADKEDDRRGRDKSGAKVSVYIEGPWKRTVRCGQCSR